MTPLFVAADDREAARLEQLLNTEHIEYELEIVTRETGGACFQALQFKVAESDLERSRRLIAQLR